MEKLFTLIERHFDKFAFGTLLLLALAIRLVLFPIVSRDHQDFLLPWCNYIDSHGGFWALKEKFYDYSPLYMYYLVFITFLKIESTASIKLLSVLFDFLMAYQVYRLIRWKWGNGKWPYVAALAILFAPTFILNSSTWGQCDAIYVFFALLSVIYLLKERYLLAFVLYGISISLKLQAIFLLPFFLVLFLKERKFPIWHFLIIPLIYFLSVIPCWIAGQPLSSLLLVYVNQMSTYDRLSLLAPTFFQWIPAPQEYLKHFALLGIFLTSAVVVSFSWLIIRSPIRLGKENILQTAVLFVLAIPFFLPRMHERYFYLAETLTLVYAFFTRKHFYLPIILLLVSSYTYISYLFMNESETGFAFLSMLVLSVLCYFAWQFLKVLWPSHFQRKPEQAAWNAFPGGQN